MQFADLKIDPTIIQALTDCGYITPTEIQSKAIPVILTGKDVIGATETGSGKTAAFVIPALDLLARIPRQPKASILILTPTRELAHQITDAIRKYGKFRKLKVAKIIGGAPYREQERMLKQPLDIIVATPGRLIDHIRNHRADLSGIKMLVLDEADRMLDMGFVDDVKLIAQHTPPRQTLLFTATLDTRLTKSVGHLLKDPVIIDLSKSQIVPDQIVQQLFIANDSQQKINFLVNLLEEGNIFKGIIFSATKVGADKIAYHLRNQGHSALALHGDLKQRVRSKSLQQLENGNVQYLVATDLASRGIHVDNITHVINFDLPRCSEDYIHRVGRTGRAGKPGTAITIALKDEKRYIFSIEKRVGSKLQLINYNREPEVRNFNEEKKNFRFHKRPSNKKRFNRSSQHAR